MIIFAERYSIAVTKEFSMPKNSPDLPFGQYRFSLSDPKDTEDIMTICHALSSQERLTILRMLYAESMSITKIARAIGISVSTACFHVRTLQEAGLVNVTTMQGKHGTLQLCQSRFVSLNLLTAPTREMDAGVHVTHEVPVGLYTGAHLEPDAGFCTANEQIMFSDGNIFTPRRADAQILWASGGYVEYSVSNTRRDSTLRRFTVTLEICSETLNYCIGWKSDITFWLNGVELCTKTSPSDFGGRRGKFTPSWWPDASTQYGELIEISVTENGVSINGFSTQPESGPTIADFDHAETFVLRIGNKEDARHRGGFNIFGRGFGDYPQDISVETVYEA